MNRHCEKTTLLLLIIMIGLCLGGCGLRDQAREVDQLLVVQTMGIDACPQGVLLSLSSAGGSTPDQGMTTFIWTSVSFCSRGSFEICAGVAMPAL